MKTGKCNKRLNSFIHLAIIRSVRKMKMNSFDFINNQQEFRIAQWITKKMRTKFSQSFPNFKSQISNLLGIDVTLLPPTPST